MFCVNCGSRMADDARFCVNCGAAAEQEAPKPTEPAPQEAYTAPQQTYAAPQQTYAAPQQTYAAPQQTYVAPQQTYAAPPQQAQNFAAAATTAATAAATTAAAAAAPAASGASFAAGAAAGVAVAKTASAGKRLLTVGAVLAIILAAFTAYFTYFVETPSEVVEKYFEAVEDYDINAMIECMEPSAASQIDGMLGVGSSLFGAITGFDVDFGALVDMSSMFSDYMPEMDYDADNFEVISYSGDKLSGFLEEFGDKWNAVGNAIADEAVVEFDINNVSGGMVSVPSSASRVRVRVTVKNCGDDGWRLPMDAMIEYVGDA